MRQSTRATRAIQRPRRIARAPDDSRSVACPSPKLYPACIFNYFLRPPAARSDDAILRLRRSQSPVRTPVVASLSAPAHPYIKINVFWKRGTTTRHVPEISPKALSSETSRSLTPAHVGPSKFRSRQDPSLSSNDVTMSLSSLTLPPRTTSGKILNPRNSLSRVILF